MLRELTVFRSWRCLLVEASPKVAALPEFVPVEAEGAEGMPCVLSELMPLPFSSRPSDPLSNASDPLPPLSTPNTLHSIWRWPGTVRICHRVRKLSFDCC